MGHTLSAVRRPREQGFSLTELLIVIMIMGLLIGFTLARWIFLIRRKCKTPKRN